MTRQGAQVIRAVIAGASGYTGNELARLLSDHPAVNIISFLSSSLVGEAVADHIPYRRGRGRGDAETFQPFESLAHADCDVVFFATPHGVAMREARALIESGKVVIDLGADFRLKDAAQFQKWYGDHTDPDLLQRAVYGLSEFAREQIKTADLIACPGCYATAIEIALLPFVAGGHITGDVIADAKSGTSGAGRQSNRPELLLAEMANNYKAYALGGHRHHAEIMQTLNAAAAENTSAAPLLTFVPHLLPIARGLYAGCYIQTNNAEIANADTNAAADIINEYWRDEPFIETLPAPLTAELAQAAYTNKVIVSAHGLGGNRALICATLDNLLKGAAGQAIQNMNIRFGLPETCGLPGARQ